MSKSFVSSSVTAGTVENTLQATPMLSETQHLRPQSSTASPVPTESIHLTVHTCTEPNYSTTLTINNSPIIGSKGYIEANVNVRSKLSAGDKFEDYQEVFEDFELVRGDFGAKEWTPPPNLGLGRNQGRSNRQRGHRPTRSDSAVQFGTPQSTTLSRSSTNGRRRSSSSRRAQSDQASLKHSAISAEQAPSKKEMKASVQMREAQAWVDGVESRENLITHTRSDISISAPDRVPVLSTEVISSCGGTKTPFTSQKQKKKESKSSSTQKKRSKSKQTRGANADAVLQSKISTVEIAAENTISPSPSPSSDREHLASTDSSKSSKKSKRTQKPKQQQQKKLGVTETSDGDAKDGKVKKAKFKPRHLVEPVQEITPISQNNSAPSTAPSSPRGLGMRSVVDDLSECGDVLVPLSPGYQSLEAETNRLLGMAYDEAVKFMDAFIEHPDYYTSRASKLTFLQALIVELGLVSTTGPYKALPGSLSSAKALLKSNAFLNVKDYLAVRGQGLDALRGAMRPSRNALVKELRGVGARKSSRAKLGWVKETGLTVLLVSCR
ncbi:hypothetical protein PNOK_0027300 [Pyrrhoderma noxium]|uniref:Uncharacterized protein n=1 Tax=Pyrrhoderma noxium TaxID=2282107 RepID=A0A286UUS6_9AGAM|nr:hypothetical protein PNOK_0027300 [Pyrrhoderma noxium]